MPTLQDTLVKCLKEIVCLHKEDLISFQEKFNAGEVSLSADLTYENHMYKLKTTLDEENEEANDE